MEGMLDLGPNARLELLSPFEQSSPRAVRQRPALARPQGDVPGHAAVAVLFPLLDALIARITKGHRLLTLQQGMGLGDVADMGGGSDEGVGQPGFRVNPDVRLHAEAPRGHKYHWLPFLV